MKQFKPPSTLRLTGDLIIVSQYNTVYNKFCPEYILLYFSPLVLSCVSYMSMMVGASLPDLPKYGAG